MVQFLISAPRVIVQWRNQKPFPPPSKSAKRWSTAWAAPNQPTTRDSKTTALYPKAARGLSYHRTTHYHSPRATLQQAQACLPWVASENASAPPSQFYSCRKFAVTHFRRISLSLLLSASLLTLMPALLLTLMPTSSFQIRFPHRRFAAPTIWDLNSLRRVALAPTAMGIAALFCTGRGRVAPAPPGLPPNIYSCSSYHF
ncbi:uncharacterized protein F5891DRAFT_1183277 [Suillus fuscotomentosus]|uniref:Uncharacterized protein n=1 Tax=Suillus fuscotomentosus TaxID=1912939 RepID=A0AAD4HRX9_9AGAM|nr:uncharacterized protein F5891DRAFT_1183277 [Suillus fuscotomentosus]KAG1905339.1 hypothetical protein F5891DRAFT_1183277 [Suillus fuscotomentosus]